MRTVQGIGGVFIYARDARGLAAWYGSHLGMHFREWGDSYGNEWPSCDLDETGRRATTTFAIFQAQDPGALGPRTARVNFRVADLDACLALLAGAGIPIEAEQEDGPYGRFAWIADPEGNRVELWQPPALGEGWPEDDPS